MLSIFSTERRPAPRATSLPTVELPCARARHRPLPRLQGEKRLQWGSIRVSTCSMAAWSVDAYGRYSRAFDHDLGVGPRRARALQVAVKHQADAFVSGRRHAGVAPHRV